MHPRPVSAIATAVCALLPVAAPAAAQGSLGRHSAEPYIVSFSEAPSSLRLYARDAGGRAAVALIGIVHKPGWQRIHVVVTQDGVPFDTDSAALSYTGGTASFQLGVAIDAGLHDYAFSVRLEASSGALRTVCTMDGVACGDVYLIQGQSNAVAADYHRTGRANQNQSHWVRTFGSSSPDPEQAVADLRWAVADGVDRYRHGTIGAWALRMAWRIVEDHDLPVCVLNGAVGGTSSSYHLRNDVDPDDPATNYGRLLYRAVRAGVHDKARALLFYQGESNGPMALRWYQDFGSLYDDWNFDYPALDKIYVFQVRQGCGSPSLLLRDTQRLMPMVFPMVRVMSTTGAPDHDGCHFGYAGYEELGERAARLLARDFYGQTALQNVDPPDADRAEFVGGRLDQVVLTFRDLDDVLVWEQGAGAYFEFTDGATITHANVFGNTITLTLDRDTSSPTIAYLGHAENGPWLRNIAGVGALAFRVLIQ